MKRRGKGVTVLLVSAMVLMTACAAPGQPTGGGEGNLSSQSEDTPVNISEEQDIEAFIEKLEKLYPGVQYVNRLMTHSWGQKVIRFYDLDGNLIEVGTPM